jgi:hypothetical protein
VILVELEERCVGSDLEYRPSSPRREILIGSHSPSSGRILQSFNWYYEGSVRLSLRIEILITGSTKLFSQKPGESLDDCFARFELIVSSLCSCGPLAYSDNERAK